MWPRGHGSCNIELGGPAEDEESALNPSGDLEHWSYPLLSSQNGHLGQEGEKGVSSGDECTEKRRQRAFVAREMARALEGFSRLLCELADEAEAELHPDLHLVRPTSAVPPHGSLPTAPAS